MKLLACTSWTTVESPLPAGAAAPPEPASWRTSATRGWRHWRTATQAMVLTAGLSTLSSRSAARALGDRRSFGPSSGLGPRVASFREISPGEPKRGAARLSRVPERSPLAGIRAAPYVNWAAHNSQIWLANLAIVLDQIAAHIEPTAGLPASAASAEQAEVSWSRRTAIMTTSYSPLASGTTVASTPVRFPPGTSWTSVVQHDDQRTGSLGGGHRGVLADGRPLRPGRPGRLLDDRALAVIPRRPARPARSRRRRRRRARGREARACPGHG